MSYPSLSMTRRTYDPNPPEGGERQDLSRSHPGYGLVSARQFARLRAADLIPRPAERRRRPTGYGSTIMYPAWTRSQLQDQLALEQAGVRGADNQRLLLWIDGYPIPLSRVAADLKTITDSALRFASRACRDFEADHIVFEMLDGHDPSQFIRWAREQLPKRPDLEAALLQMVQLASGTSPSDLMLDPESARPLQLLMGAVLPGLVPTAEELANAMSADDGLADFMSSAATFPCWSLPEWVDARDDQLLLRQTGNWNLPTAGLSGFLLLSIRLAFLIACGAMRRTDRQGWQTRIDEIRAGVSMGSVLQPSEQGEQHTQEAC